VLSRENVPANGTLAPLLDLVMMTSIVQMVGGCAQVPTLRLGVLPAPLDHRPAQAGARGSWHARAT
jgi:hypothetical protein